MFTLVVEPSVIPPRMNEKLVFFCNKELCKESLTRYKLEGSSHWSPNEFWNAVYAGSGSQMYGSDESRIAVIGSVKRPSLIPLVVPVMDSSCTASVSVKSKGQEPSCWVNRD